MTQVDYFDSKHILYHPVACERKCVRMSVCLREIERGQEMSLMPAGAHLCVCV